VGHHTEAFVGIDTSKLRNAVAIADSGRGGEVRYLGGFMLAREVYTIEIVPELGKLARTNLERLGYSNVSTGFGKTILPAPQATMTDSCYEPCWVLSGET
jgi:hypothetical protein